MSVLDAVRRPEHTGENRCWPCTALNLALVGAAVAGAAALRRRALAVAVAALGAAAVVLRGYVVPYTPTFAPRVVAALSVSFGPESAAAESIPVSTQDTDDRTPDSPAESDDLSDASGRDAGRRVVETLFAAGALRESGDGELRLADDVREARTAEMARLRELDDGALATAAADAAPYPAVARAEHGGVTIEATEADGDADVADRSAWLTRALTVADVASVRALRDAGVDPGTAVRAAVPLRTLLETCPLCGGRVVETTYVECCGGSGSIYETPGEPVLACDDCGEVVQRLEEDE